MLSEAFRIQRYEKPTKDINNKDLTTTFLSFHMNYDGLLNHLYNQN